MATFKFNLDQKCTVWYRTDFDVEANSEQEAIEKATAMFSSGELDDYPWYGITDTIEPLFPSENEGQPTQELMFKDNTIETNQS
jgi:hypothetical protein